MSIHLVGNYLNGHTRVYTSPTASSACQSTTHAGRQRNWLLIFEETELSGLKICGRVRQKSGSFQDPNDHSGLHLLYKEQIWNH